jgi:hypothetical protein
MQIQELDTELSRLERQCHAQNVDVRPWVSNGHSLSTEHWGLTQRRLRLLCPGRHGGVPKASRATTAAKRTLTLAHLAAMKAGRRAKLGATA